MTTTTINSGYAAEFLRGYDAADLSRNPYLLTSDCSDAFVLGTWCRRNGKPVPRELRKSRGYTWLIDGARVRVDGAEVQPL